MKKSLIIMLVACICLATGCTKNYKSVSEYADAMAQVRKNLRYYTIETVISNNSTDSYFRSYIKGDKWKTETSQNSGKTYDGNGVLYDGVEVYSYSSEQHMAVSIPFGKMLEKQGVKDKKITNMIMKYINPAGFVYDWTMEDKDLDKSLTFGKKNVKKNGFKCRMLQSTNDDSEICVSDKYGIAVYAKLKDNKKGGYVEFNVNKVNNLNISDYDLELPAGVKKLSMATMLQDLSNMMK